MKPGITKGWSGYKQCGIIEVRQGSQAAEEDAAAEETKKEERERKRMNFHLVSIVELSPIQPCWLLIICTIVY